MGIESVFALLAVVLLAAVFLHHNRLNQLARNAATSYCKRQQFQLLDDSVVLCAIRWSRRSAWVLERRYRFEFALVGGRRYRGWVLLAGERTQGVETQPVPEAELPP